MTTLPTPRQLAQIVGLMADQHRFVDRAASLGLTGRWADSALERASPEPGERVLLVGDADISLEGKIRAQISPDGYMLHRSTGSTPWEPVGPFDLCVAAYALPRDRSPAGLLSDLARSLRPGGRVVVLDLTPPANAFTRAYTRGVVPGLGTTLARMRGVQYESPPPAHLHPPLALAGFLQRAGFQGVRYRVLPPGLVAVHSAQRSRE